jgi:hypothetical protein
MLCFGKACKKVDLLGQELLDLLGSGTISFDVSQSV